MDQINKKLYEICMSKRSRSPFVICVSIGEDTFSDVYINCQYSSDIGKCSLKDISLDKYIRGSTNIYKI